MAQKGRPRNYDSAAALDKIMVQFWRKGYTATSLDELAAETDMRKPSLYAAFGNKERLYQLAMDRFGEIAQAHYTTALAPKTPGEPLTARLTRWLQATVTLYTGEHDPAGCMVLSTAAAEVYDPAIRKRLQEVIAAQEMMVLDCLNEEKTALRDPDSAPLLAKTLTAFLHSISLRARAGESAEQLAEMVRAGQLILQSALTSPAA
ncbi:TPA: TetR/AcrR family transcriptional regulator [Morganella morganii]|uniref:TetR/AcrR family transcriptional regulator n=1 Tax=Morganella morganii TaxID=582 RepID=A0AAN5MD33_MORMO|nr:TetR/AcrR family transcriptional regulator [Morganella morganii]